MRQHFQALKIREAEDEDNLAAYQWINSRIEIAQPIMRSPNGQEWVAEQSIRIVGFVQLVFYPFDNTYFGGYWLFSLMIRTYMRGIGIGERLSRVVIDKAKEEGALFLRLIFFEDNNAAVHLY